MRRDVPASIQISRYVIDFYMDDNPCKNLLIVLNSEFVRISLLYRFLACQIDFWSLFDARRCSRIYLDVRRFDFYMDDPVRLIAVLESQVNRPAKEWFYLPALALLALVWFAQRRRLRIASAQG